MKRVAPPVGEPRIAGDDRASVAALHDVGVGGAFQRRREGGAPLLFAPLKARGRRDRRLARRADHRFVSLGGEQQHRLAGAEIEAQFAGRGEVLAAVEAARALLGVEEVAVPVGSCA